MKSNLTIDARWLEGGIGTYTRHLLEGLWKHGNGFEVHAITRERHREEVKQWCSRATVVEIPIYTAREQWAVPRAAKGCDLLHVPHYNAPLLHRGPMLVSILDLIHIMDPAYRRSLKSWVYARPMLNLVARKADHIVTISEYSKTQIVERLGVPSSKVTVIYCGINEEFRPMGREEAFGAVSAGLGIQEPYVLYVGSLKPYKNVSSLLKAFAMLRRRCDIPHRLLILGDDVKWKGSLVEECARLKIEERTTFVSHVGRGLLPKVYAAADLLMMPSRIEGFGLPVVEAMACGTPVICSQVTSLPEVGGDAVVYFDPGDPEELARAMERVLGSRELQQDLATKGLERAKRFSWEESTRKHVELYQYVLGTSCKVAERIL
jgi:glycosyltransferase involved in cell wall biosynthesis